jgi:hypothetical protein
MRWFRDNIRHGSWLALIALAVNIALSFGHIHAIAGQNAPRGRIMAALASSDHRSTQGDSDHSQADYLCPICIAAGAMANALAAAPPIVSLQLTETAVDRTVVPVRIVLEQPRAAFRSRGPPAS